MQVDGIENEIVEYEKQVEIEIVEYEKQNEKVNEEEEEGGVPFVACVVTEELEYVNQEAEL